MNTLFHSEKKFLMGAYNDRLYQIESRCYSVNVLHLLLSSPIHFFLNTLKTITIERKEWIYILRHLSFYHSLVTHIFSSWLLVLLRHSIFYMSMFIRPTRKIMWNKSKEKHFFIPYLLSCVYNPSYYYYYFKNATRFTDKSYSRFRSTK